LESSTSYPIHFVRSKEGRCGADAENWRPHELSLKCLSILCRLLMYRSQSLVRKETGRLSEIGMRSALEEISIYLKISWI